MLADSGIYEDYDLDGLFMVLRDFDPAAELEGYLALRPTQRERYEFQNKEYLTFLQEKRLLSEFKYSRLHLSDYGCAERFYFTPGEE